MSHNWEQDFRAIGEQLSNARDKDLSRLGGEEAQVASLAANGSSLHEVCERMSLEPDQAWAMLNEAFDRIQGTHWSEGPSGDIRPMDTDTPHRPKQDI